MILYGVIGLTGVAIDLTTFFILFNLFHIDENISNLVAMTPGIINNFYLNARFNFKKTDNMTQRFISYYLVSMFGAVLMSLNFFIFSDNLGISPNIVKVVGLIPVTLIQFLLNKFISFRTH